MRKITTEKKGQTIILHYLCSDGKLKYYTGEKPGSPKIDMMRKTIAKVVLDHERAGIDLTREILKHSLNSLYRPGNAVKQGFYESALRVIEKMRSGEILTPQMKPYSLGTLRTITNAMNIIHSFSPHLSQEDITLKTYGQFIKWCQGQDYSTNYIGTLINRWKTIGKHIGGNSIYDHPDFKKISEQTPDVYLNEKEIKDMIDLDLPTGQAVIRDWFVIGCYTGLRVSDLLRLRPQNYSNGFITISNEKTDEKVKLPVHQAIKDIIKKYKGFPPKVYDQDINEVIKSVARKAGITSKELFIITKGGKRQDHYLEKWEMISTHTCRRSFITNLNTSGLPNKIVMKLTGIRSLNTLNRYNKLGTEEAASIASKHKFFK